MTPITWYLYGRSGGAKKAIEEIGIKGSVSGSVAAFPDGANDVAVKSLVAEITPVQSGTGDPSPSNVRPISGRTGLTIDATAANIWDGQVTLGGYYDSTGAWRTDSNILGCANAIPVRPGMQLYCYSANGAAVYVSLFSRMVTIGTSATDAFISRTRRENQTFTIPDGVECLYFNFASTYGTTYQNDVSINYPSTVQTMSPTARLIPIDWQTQAGTVYGGTLDVVSGVLTVDRAIVEMDGSTDETWVALSTPNVFRHNALVPAALVARRTDAITNETNVVTYSYDTMKNNYPSISFDTNGRLFIAIGDSYTTVAQCREWLAANPLQVCYYITTPTTYQLTPTEIKTLLGGNTVYTDAGAVSVTYVADTKLYIDNKVAELQALILEN